MTRIKRAAWAVHDYTLATAVCVVFVLIQFAAFVVEYEERS
jgi:hypothetical protein